MPLVVQWAPLPPGGKGEMQRWQQLQQMISIMDSHLGQLPAEKVERALGKAVEKEEEEKVLGEGVEKEETSLRWLRGERRPPQTPPCCCPPTPHYCHIMEKEALQ